jgi:NAD(P)-dependent dehydrogenase (short-subunit alcohol dehydrogenase family)
MSALWGRVGSAVAPNVVGFLLAGSGLGTVFVIFGIVTAFAAVISGLYLWCRLHADGTAQSKTANVLFAVEATRRWANDGITVNALQPGTVRSNLQRYVIDEDLERMRVRTGDPGVAYQWKTPEQGAATSVLVATSPLLERIGGRYFEDCNEAGPNQPGTRRGVAAYALDPEAAVRLWEVSRETLAS